MASLAERVTRCLHFLFECEISSFYLFDPSAARWNTVVVSPTVPKWEEAMEVLQLHAHEHPLLTHAARTGFSQAIRLSDVLGLRQYRRSGLYHDFVRIYFTGLTRQLGFVAKPDSALTLGVSLNRSGRDFSSEQCALLELLRPHLIHAYATARDHAHLLERIDAERATGAVVAGGGRCQIDARGKLEWATDSAEKLLGQYFPTERARSGYLPPSLLQTLKPVLRPRRESENFLPQRRTWEFSGTRGMLRVHLAASPATGSWQMLLSEERFESTAEQLEAKHGLSRREAETLYWIGQGKANDEIGIIIGIATRTVETYVGRIFEKLDVYNRTTAARIAMGR